MTSKQLFWTKINGVVGKYSDVHLERHLLGLWRVVKTTKNHFPPPKPRKFYLFSKNQAEKFYRELAFHESSNTGLCHTPPDRKYIEENKTSEPEGERIRAELEDFIARNNIVGILIDTDKHSVDIQIARLPPRIKSVLSKWGSIYVVDEQHEKEGKW